MSRAAKHLTMMFHACGSGSSARAVAEARGGLLPGCWNGGHAGLTPLVRALAEQHRPPTRLACMEAEF